MKIGLLTLSSHLSTQVTSIFKDESEFWLVWNVTGALEVIEKQKSNPADIFLISTDVPLSVAKRTVRDIMSVSKCLVFVVTRDSKRDVHYIFDIMNWGVSGSITLPFEPTEAERKKFLGYLRTHKPLTAPDKRSGEQRPYRKPTLVAIGASTGGPGILTTIMQQLFQPIPVAIIIILHVAKSFTENMVVWMQTYTKIPVQIAQEGERPSENNIYLAATDDHLILDSNECFRYRKAEMKTFYHPSVDIFFNSIVRREPSGLAVLLTGMGEDGARGLLNLRRAGWYTVAQNEETCVVYGMPKVAKDLGAAMKVLNPDQIAMEINFFARINEFRSKNGSSTRKN